MLKIGLRINLFYLLMLTIFTFFRKVDLIMMKQIIGLKSSLLLTFLMFLGELFTGIIIYIYQISFFRKQKDTEKIFMGIKLIQASSELSYPDSDFKIFILIFIASYFDFIEFMMATYYLPQYNNISNSLDKRLNGMLTISAAFLCYFLLKLPIFKHQIFSLSIIFVCFIVVLFFEYYFKIIYEKENPIYLTIVIGLIFITHFFTAFKDVIEKYLLEIDYINPFKLIMIEGIFGCILTSIYSIKEEPFTKIISIYKEHNYKFILLIVCLFLFSVFSGGRNAYRIITNKIYSPMTRTLTDCALDPLLIAYFYYFEKDFSIKGIQNIIYFIINLVISIIIVFFGCVYNELFILFCFGLEHNTYHYVSIRASRPSNNYIFIKKKHNIRSKLSDNKLKIGLSGDDTIEENIFKENISEEDSYINDSSEITISESFTPKK